MQQPHAPFPFSDIHSYKDYVVFVQTYLPDNFPPREGYTSDEQWTFDYAFEGLRYGLELARIEKVKPDIVQKCSQMIETAFQQYRKGDDDGGFHSLEGLTKTLRRIQTH